MDFSSLDLLASTALRDNNQSHVDNNSTAFTDSQLKHDDTVEGDEEDDDDEADVKTYVRFVAESEALAGQNLKEGCEMGSVKCGKHKKSISKPVIKTILVQDGKCVAKKKSLTGMILPGMTGDKVQVTGHSDIVGPCSVNSKDMVELYEDNTTICGVKSSLQETEVLPGCKSEISAHLCNGTNNIDHKLSVHNISSSSEDNERVTETNGKQNLLADANSCRSHLPGTACVPPRVMYNQALYDSQGTVQKVPSNAQDSATDGNAQILNDSSDSQLTKVSSGLQVMHAALCDSQNVKVLDFNLTIDTDECNSPDYPVTALCNSQATTDKSVLCDKQGTVTCAVADSLTETNFLMESGHLNSDETATKLNSCSITGVGIRSHLSCTNSLLDKLELSPEPAKAVTSGIKSLVPSVDRTSADTCEETLKSKSPPIFNGNEDTASGYAISMERMESHPLSANSREKTSSQLPSTVGQKQTIVAIDRCSNSDTDHTVMLTSSACLSPFPLSYSSVTSSSSFPALGIENDFAKDVLDQDICSSGSKRLDFLADSSCVILSLPAVPFNSFSPDVILLDHCYCCSTEKLALRQNIENTDDSGDAFESADENVSADDTERRPRSLSVDSEYLQYGVPPVTNQADKNTLLSPTLSVDSVSNDSSLSEHSAVATGHFYSTLVGSQNPARMTPQQKLALLDSPGLNVESQAAGIESGHLTSNLADVSSCSLSVGGPKCGRFRIGTFGSFSNSHLELDTEIKKTKLKIGIPQDSVMKTSMSSPALISPVSPFPLLQSPGLEWDRSDAGSEAPDDLDSSTTEDRLLNSSNNSEILSTISSQVWHHPVFHDHDYCCKEISEKLGKPVTSVPLMKGSKRKYTRKKAREFENEKLKKGKYLKRELLRQDNRFSLMGTCGSRLDNKALASRSSLMESKPNPVGRPRKRFDKQTEEYDAGIGTKMKITGKYQDQYVYYYSKTSRNRRRKVDEKISLGDKIILPPSKPGDIVVPHLTDADCEAIRRGGRSAFKGGGTYFSPSHHSVQLLHGDSGDIMDSSIVNTILSMENDNFASSPLSSHEGDGDFEGITENLTTEQVDLLLDCLKDVEVPSSSQALELMTSAETITMVPTSLDSLTGTTVEREDFMVSELPLPNSTALPSKPISQTPVNMDPVDGSEIQIVSGSVEMPFVNQETVEKDIESVVPNSTSRPSVTRPSVEKNLEFLKNPFIRPDFYPGTASVVSITGQDFVSAAQNKAVSDVNETPWIVTVTLYWNDIPAIINNNVPYVRLVDIHRQILPAKDTGILKKRCQLMHIPVSNCSEMQRYFLVQYGRAHNSKSTLVITKDEACRLISYYAHPQPRNLRGEERMKLRRTSSYAELRSVMGNGGNPRHSTSVPTFPHPRRRGGFRRRTMPPHNYIRSPEQVLTPITSEGVGQPLVSSLPADLASPSKRLRHKKINFLEMLKGDFTSQSSDPVVEHEVSGESSLMEEKQTASNNCSKASIQVHQSKRRNCKETSEVSPSKFKCNRKGRHRNENSKKLSPNVSLKQAREPEIVVDLDLPDSVSVKNKKRSSAVTSHNSSNYSPKSRLGPIKVNVKSLVRSGHSSLLRNNQPRKNSLFGKKKDSVGVTLNTVTSARPLRVLRISHQDAKGVATSQQISPMAEVHLDLYKRATSPCVRCSTCDKFLSVPGFLKHQHTSPVGSNGSEDVINMQQQRMLVPMNKENISTEEQHLWNEFVALQAYLDHSVSASSMGAYSFSSASSSLTSSGLVCGKSSIPQEEKYDLKHPNHKQRLSPVHTILTDSNFETVTAVNLSAGKVINDKACPVSNILGSETSTNSYEPQLSVRSSSLLILPSTHTQIEEKIIDSAEKDGKEIPLCPQKGVPTKKRRMQRSRRNAQSVSIRTSSRKRKRKQFYSFENYEFSAGVKKSGRAEADVQEAIVNGTKVPTGDINTCSFAVNNGSSHLDLNATVQE